MKQGIHEYGQVLHCPSGHVTLEHENEDDDSSRICSKCSHPLSPPPARPNRYDNTLISAFDRCPRYGYFRHELGLKPSGADYSEALAAGSLWHFALETLYKTQDVSGTLLAMQKKHSEMEQAGEKLPTTNAESSIGRRSLEHLMKVLLTYVEHYDVGTGREFEDKMRPVRNENGEPYIELNVQVRLDDDILYFGRIDMIAEMEGSRRGDRKFYIVDHKTSLMNTANLRETYNLSHQFLGYQVGILATKEAGVDISGSIVNHVTWNKNIQPDRDFHRFVIPFDESKLFDWAKQISWKTKMIKNMRAEGMWPQHTSNCSMYGRICEYAKLCKTRNPRILQGLLETGFEVDYWVKGMEESKDEKETPERSRI